MYVLIDYCGNIKYTKKSYSKTFECSRHSAYSVYALIRACQNGPALLLYSTQDMDHFCKFFSTAI